MEMLYLQEHYLASPSLRPMVQKLSLAIYRLVHRALTLAVSLAAAQIIHDSRELMGVRFWFVEEQLQLDLHLSQPLLHAS
jgi:hypothetical protein